MGGGANYGLGECNNCIHHGTTEDISGGWNVRTVGAAKNAQNAGRLKRMQDTSMDIVNVSNYAKLLKNTTQLNTENRNYVLDSNDPDEIIYYILATIPLKHVCSLLKEMPLVRGARVEIILQMNAPCSVSTSIAGTTVIGYNNTTYSASSNGTIPFQLSPALYNSSVYGCNPITTAGTVMKCTLGIAKSYQTLTSRSHPQSTCRLYLPVYELSPSYESQLLSKHPVKEIVYNDIFTSQYLNVAIGSQFQYNIPSLVSKPRYLLIAPYLASTTNGGDDPTSTTAGNGYIVGSPMNSPFSSAPATTSPYLTLSNFNVFVGGKALFQESRNYDWQQFLTENRPSNCINGGLTNGMSCGLIDEHDFKNGYGFVYVDLSRHSLANDLTQHQISVSATNNNLVPVDLYVTIGYEKVLNMSVANGQVVEN